MGKGDGRTRRGKIFKGSHGNPRRRGKKTPTTAKKPAKKG